MPTLRLLALAIILLPFGLGFSPPPPGQAAPAFQVVFIAVEQGDAILVRDGAGFDALVDGGQAAAAVLVLEALRQAAVDDLEALVATHADRDHTGGLVGVLESGEIPVEAVFYNGCQGDTQTWADFEAAVAAAGLAFSPLQRGQNLSWGRLQAQILNPEPGAACSDANRASVVVRLVFGQIEVLLTGDIDEQVEAGLAVSGLPLAAEALKVAHHGSASGSGAQFLAAVAPQQAIISTGPNAYGHPDPGTMGRLSEAGARLWRTDFLGTVTLTSDGVEYRMGPSGVYLPAILRSFP